MPLSASSVDATGLDLDRHPNTPDGVAAFKELCADRLLPKCPMTRTPSNGFHLIFRQPPGEPLGNAEGSLPDSTNCRGSGGWVVAAGSSYKQWRWEQAATAELQELPAWVVAIIKTPKAKAEAASQPAQASVGVVGKRERAYASKALEQEAIRLAATKRLKRNIELNNAALKIGHMVGAGWIGRATVEGRLLDAARANGSIADDGEQAARDTIKSGLDAGNSRTARAAVG
jgi:hypothetical protein